MPSDVHGILRSTSDVHTLSQLDDTKATFMVELEKVSEVREFEEPCNFLKPVCFDISKRL